MSGVVQNTLHIFWFLPIHDDGDYRPDRRLSFLPLTFSEPMENRGSLALFVYWRSAPRLTETDYG